MSQWHRDLHCLGCHQWNVISRHRSWSQPRSLTTIISAITNLRSDHTYFRHSKRNLIGVNQGNANGPFLPITRYPRCRYPCLVDLLPTSSRCPLSSHGPSMKSTRRATTRRLSLTQLTCSILPCHRRWPLLLLPRQLPQCSITRAQQWRNLFWIVSDYQAWGRRQTLLHRRRVHFLLRRLQTIPAAMMKCCLRKSKMRQLAWPPKHWPLPRLMRITARHKSSTSGTILSCHFWCSTRDDPAHHPASITPNSSPRMLISSDLVTPGFM